MDPKRDFRRPRVVLEAHTDEHYNTTYFVEYYKNGQRVKEQVLSGLSADLLDALGEAQRELTALRKREAQTEADKAAALHRRNYYYAANARHLGVEFANKVITKPRSELQRLRDAGLAPPAAQAADDSVL